MTRWGAGKAVVRVWVFFFYFVLKSVWTNWAMTVAETTGGGEGEGENNEGRELSIAPLSG
jgi:hypothetical protein